MELFQGLGPEQERSGEIGVTRRVAKAGRGRQRVTLVHLSHQGRLIADVFYVTLPGRKIEILVAANPAYQEIPGEVSPPEDREAIEAFLQQYGR